MSEEGDNPIVSAEVQSTSMESLNDELTPKTEKPRQEVKSENNIQHEIGGFKKFLTTSAQVTRLHWMPILISSIVCFVFKSDIGQVSLPGNLFALSFNVFVILLMVTLIEGGKDTLVVKMERKVKSNSVEIENLQRKLEAKQAEFDQHKVECESESKVVMALIKTKSVESEHLKRELKEKQTEFDQHKEDCKSEKKSLMATMKYNFKFKSAEIKNFKKTEGELKSRISQLKDGAKTVNARTNFKPIELTIDAKFTDISKLEEDEEVFSQPTKFNGITWKTRMEKVGDCFNFALHADKENANSWCCPGITEFRLISQKSEEIVHRTGTELICDEDGGSHWIGAVPHKDLFDEEKGYVKDDSITVAVAIKAFPISFIEATTINLCAKFSEISKLTIDKVYSETTEFEGITWKMSVCKDDDNDILFNLDAEKENADEWWCPVIVDLQLVNEQNYDEIACYCLEVYDANNLSDIIGYISFKELFDEKNEYVNDDSIMVVMNITVLPIN